MPVRNGFVHNNSIFAVLIKCTKNKMKRKKNWKVLLTGVRMGQGLVKLNNQLACSKTNDLRKKEAGYKRFTL